jgi:hypothetical protein
MSESVESNSMEPDLDVKYANETMEEWSELQIADYCLETGNFFWDLIACIDRKWVPKLFDSYLIALKKIDHPEVLEEFLRTSMDAFVWRAGKENDLIGQIAGMVADRRFPNEARGE